MLNASVEVQRVLARLRPVQSRQSTAADIIRRQRPLVVAISRRLASELLRLAVATFAVLRSRVDRRRAAAPMRVNATIARAPTMIGGRGGLAPRSVVSRPSPNVGPLAAPIRRVDDVHQPLVAARSAPSRTAAPATGDRYTGRSLIARIGAERAVPTAAVAILLVAVALSSAPSLASSGPVGGPTGDGPDARLAIGGVGGVDQGSGSEAAAAGDVGIDNSGPDGGQGAVDGAVGLPGDAYGSIADDGAIVDDSLVDDGTLFKPVAVDTSVSDGKGLMRTYRVRNGDTLTGIARKFGVTMMTIWWANQLNHKDDLHIGQILTIPPVNGVVVTVGSTDTLDSLAAKYGVEASTIVDANALEDPNLVIGQTLTVPGALGDEIAKPKPTRTPSRSRPGHSSGSSRSVSPPSRYNGGKFSWPVAGGYISQYFHYGHYAIDIAADRGTMVKAAAAGVVTFAGWKSNGGGYQVWISHGSGLYTTYNHMSSVSVSRGQHVSRSQMVGRVGMSGNASGPHLHFEVWRGPVWTGGTRVNPLLYL